MHQSSLLFTKCRMMYISPYISFCPCPTFYPRCAVVLMLCPAVPHSPAAAAVVNKRPLNQVLGGVIKSLKADKSFKMYFGHQVGLHSCI